MNFELKREVSYTYDYPRPCVTVDAVVFRKNEDHWEVLLIKRKLPPYEGAWALPGGFVDMGETLEEAVVRELDEETGLKGIQLHQLKAFSAIDRDPRARTISVVFYGFACDGNSEVVGSDDADIARWFPVDDVPDLAFDHADILKKGMDKLS